MRTSTKIGTAGLIAAMILQLLIIGAYWMRPSETDQDAGADVPQNGESAALVFAGAENVVTIEDMRRVGLLFADDTLIEYWTSADHISRVVADHQTLNRLRGDSTDVHSYTLLNSIILSEPMLQDGSPVVQWMIERVWTPDKGWLYPGDVAFGGF